MLLYESVLDVIIKKVLGESLLPWVALVGFEHCKKH